MSKLRFGFAVMIVVAAAVAASASATAAPSKAGCSAESSGWMKMSVADTAETIWDGLLDQTPWGDLGTFTSFVREREDDNGDGYLCLKEHWGDDLNPNAHWYRVGLELQGEPVVFFVVVDNTANASNH